MKDSVSQKTITDRLKKILIWYGYEEDKIKPNQKDINCSNQTFRPDIVATQNRCRCVYEIEANVNNNTVFKSLISLMKYVKENSANGVTIKAYLIVPHCKFQHSEKCIKTISELLDYFSYGPLRQTFFDKINLISFEEISRIYHAEKNKTVGRPTVCLFI